MTQLDFSINSLGHTQWPSPLSVNDADDSSYFVRDDHFILFNDQVNGESLQTPQSPVVEKLEIAGPRRHLFFEPAETRLGIVTCGGLCPGLNDVIRGLVMECQHRYKINHVYGFRNGYRGCASGSNRDVVELNVELVSRGRPTQSG